MRQVYERCCGIDVHKSVIAVCLRKGVESELRTFDTLTQSIKGLMTWLGENDCQMAAMESTGVYWKPLYNIFELSGLDVIVVNAKHMRNVPGRKTDMRDAEWIADLLQHGLLTASYIPDKGQRELRDVVRYRKSLVEERSREINRLEKILQGANIKLSSYVSAITTKSSQRLIREAVNGEVTADNIGKLIHHSMLKKQDELLKAMDGVISPLQKRLAKTIMFHIDEITKWIEELDDFIEGQMKKYSETLAELTKMPGIGKRSGEVILSEIGLDMERFPTEAHLCSWAGICPGNNESAGKRRNGRTNKGNKSLKSTLIQCAKSAQKDKNSFFYAQYQRLVTRKGANRATVAVAHSMLIAIYNIIKYKQPYKDLGSDYYAKYNNEAKRKYYLRKLSELGTPLPSSTI